jgi:hypothetical protein
MRQAPENDTPFRYTIDRGAPRGAGVDPRERNRARKKIRGATRGKRKIMLQKFWECVQLDDMETKGWSSWTTRTRSMNDPRVGHLPEQNGKWFWKGRGPCVDFVEWKHAEVVPPRTF